MKSSKPKRGKHAEGEVQETWAKTKRTVSNAVEDVADAINR
jgi:uncharacterized protein YjbJ (UPF0337 family)